MLSCCAASALAETPVELADPFLGAEGGGNTVPGAQVPFGFVMASPDTTRGDTNGYDGWSPVVGFSATHVSGTGWSSKYGNFRVTPTIGEVNPRNLSFPRSHETASPGYY
ncbi:MAG: alpha-mannosidase, partial [Asticcacaulis sp.]|nr:alpha-mannosidase [Asticcacaulis sp.]